ERLKLRQARAIATLGANEISTFSELKMYLCKGFLDKTNLEETLNSMMPYLFKKKGWCTTLCTLPFLIN
ncbi:MAG: hypothetical protein ACI3YQ_03105, partial [Prevotella sp.]